MQVNPVDVAQVNLSNIISVIAVVISFLSLLISCYATMKASRLNNLLIEKESREALNNKQADLDASFTITEGKLTIFNKGKAAARYIRIEFPEGNDRLIQSDTDRKFPLELLEPKQSVELIDAGNLGTKGKLPIRIIWSDDFAKENEKIVYPSR